MIRKILVYENALADSHPALDRALRLARHSNVELKIVDVVDPASDGLAELHHPMRSLVEQERKDRLTSICEPLRQKDLEFSVELIRGRPFVEIVREVVHEGIHLVIKSVAAGPRTANRGLMEPVDMRLVRNCPCPVWLELSDRISDSNQIVVAVDSQAEDGAFNKVLLDMAASVARKTGGEVHVVSTWEIPEEDFLTVKMRPDKLAEYAASLKQSADRSLKKLLASAAVPIDPSHLHFRKGNPASTILEYVESRQPDILVMGSVCRTDVSGLLIGNTADFVLRHVTCSVLAIKPDSLFRV